MIYSFQVYTGFQWTGYFAGEIRNVRKTATTSILGALLISAIGYVVACALIYKYYGFQFFGSVVYDGLGGGAASWKAPFQPYLPALVNFLPGPQWLLVFIAVTFLLAILWWTPTGFMMGTRNMFAWSFDRLAPEKLTTVSDRFHTPVIATITVGCIVELLNYLNIYQGLGSYLLNIIAVMGVAFIITSIAAGGHPLAAAAAARPGTGVGPRLAARRPRHHAGGGDFGDIMGICDLRRVPHRVRRNVRVQADDRGVHRPADRHRLLHRGPADPAGAGHAARPGVHGDPAGMTGDSPAAPVPPVGEGRAPRADGAGAAGSPAGWLSRPWRRPGGRWWRPRPQPVSRSG